MAFGPVEAPCPRSGTLHGLDQRVDSTLPGMPGTSTGAPAPTARLPVNPVEALGWLLVFSGLAAAAGRSLVTRLGGWLFLLSGVTVLSWCLSTDTDPWQALGQRWSLTVATVVATAAVALALRRATTGPPLATWLRGLVPTVAAVGIAVILPALTVWDAATAAGATNDITGKLGTALVAASAAVVVSGPFWRGAGALIGFTALVGAGVTAVLALLLRSVLVAAIPAALLLPRTDRFRSTPRVGRGNRERETVAV